MANPGFRSVPSFWFGPDGSTFNPASVSPAAGGFRSFQSVWFGPDGGTGTGGVTPPVTVTSGRKLISQAFTATLNGELT